MTDGYDAQFPILLSAVGERRRAGVEQALSVVFSGEEQGVIRNADYLGAKDTLGRGVEEAWRTVTAHYLSVVHANRYERGEDAASTLYYSSTTSLHAVLSLRKKISVAEKAGLAETAFAPFLNAADALEKELISLATLVRDLKSKIVKGRAPRPEPVPVNPDQVRGTCPCCFANQAVRGGTMVHHGYQRPDAGYQTASCFGINYKPYERSVEGTQHMIDRLDASIARDQATLANKANWKSLPYQRRVAISRQHPDGVEVVSVAPGDAEWDRAYKAHVVMLQSKIERNTASRNLYVERREAWVLAPLTKADGTVMPLDFEG